MMKKVYKHTVLGLGPGTNTVGASGRSRAMMNTSLSAPPEPSRCDDDLCGLKLRPVTGPECRATEETCPVAAEAEAEAEQEEQ